jgi:hypothetical protein
VLGGGWRSCGGLGGEWEGGEGVRWGNRGWWEGREKMCVGWVFVLHRCRLVEPPGLEWVAAGEMCDHCQKMSRQPLLGRVG